MTKHEPFALEIKTGFGYDSNATGTSLEQDAWVWASKGTLSYTSEPLFWDVIAQPSITVASKRLDHLESLDQDSLTAGLKLAKRIGDSFEIALSYGANRSYTSSFDKAILDLQTGALTGKYSWSYAGWDSSLTAGVAREQTSPSAYNNWKALLQVGTRKKLAEDWTFKAGFGTAYKAYDDYSRSGADERKGLELVLDAGIGWQVSEWFGLEASLAGTHSENDLAKFDYDRLVFAPALIASFKW